MTAPFGAFLEGKLKEPIQNARFSMVAGVHRHPDWFCCVSGLALDQDGNPSVIKDPVAVLKSGTGGNRVCTCETVTVDYSGSWSPTSTINTWSINWGDGNISNGAWPGAGTVAHPGGCGGYALPAVYTVTLTVTDLLGNQHQDSFEIEVVDCATWGTIEMYCATTGPGNPVWFTNDAGGNWADRSGGLQGENVRDLKINPYTVPIMAYSPIDNTETVELWAATPNGIFNCYDGARHGNSWVNMPFPQPPGAGSTLSCYAIMPSIYDRLEIYALMSYSQFAGPPVEVWLYRSIDGGWGWDYVQLTPPGAFVYFLPEMAAGSLLEGYTSLLGMSRDGKYIYVAHLTGLNKAVLTRFDYDLTNQTTLLSGLSGYWIGVQADYNRPEVVWAFGNDLLAGNECIMVSEDYGATFTDVSPWVSAYSPQRAVSVVKPSPFDPAYVFAVNNDLVNGHETAVTKDFGQNWAISPIASPFITQCGERGWYDDYLAFIGAAVPVVGDRLQLSLSLGEGSWNERSSPIPVGNQITSIQILWEHGYP